MKSPQMGPPLKKSLGAIIFYNLGLWIPRSDPLFRHFQHQCFIIVVIISPCKSGLNVEEL